MDLLTQQIFWFERNTTYSKILSIIFRGLWWAAFYRNVVMKMKNGHKNGYCVKKLKRAWKYASSIKDTLPLGDFYIDCVPEEKGYYTYR